MEHPSKAAQQTGHEAKLSISNLTKIILFELFFKHF